MKAFKKSFLVIFLFSLITQQIFSQNGTALCDSVLNYLEKAKVHLQVQPLVSNGINKLPYNIIVNFPSEDSKTNDNLILFFNIEEINGHLELLPPIFEALENRSFASTLVFSYGNLMNIPRENIICGAQVFTRSLNTTVNHAAFIFNLDSKKNSIITGSNKKDSSSWMLKDLFDAFSNAKITEGLPLVFISQVADFTFSEDKSFLAFIEAEIPCIMASIKDSSKVKDVIIDCINSYETSRKEPNDSHTFMFRIFGKRIWLSELRLINSVIIILILSFVGVFILSIANKNFKKEFWQEIKANWYVIPSIFVLSVAGFFLGKLLYILFTPEKGSPPTVFGFIILQICISMFMVSLFFMLNLSILKKYTTRSLDFIIVVDTLINVFIFTLLDISLFPIFILIFVISILSLIFRRNWVHIILFIVLILPFIPYINSLFRISDADKLHELLISSRAQPFLLSLILLPVYLMWLRILNAIKKRYPKKRIYALVISATYLFIVLDLIVLNRIFYSTEKRQNNLIVIEDNSSSFDFSLDISEKKVFSDTVRNVIITSSSQPLYTSLYIEAGQGEENPVLYSENEFLSLDAKSCIFSLPLYPPERLEFNYGSENKKQTLTAEQIFYDDEEERYFSVKKSIVLEGNK